MIEEKTYKGDKTNMHVLKTEHNCWQAIYNGTKTFEYRKNDRDFKIGDTLLLKNYYPETESTGGEIHCDITYILYGGKFGIPDDYCIMQLKIISK
ncbi:MAG: DUF3850 domain-containing protein [Candidatus Micrarchaeota archaeon]